MCFLKTFKQLDTIPVEKSPQAEESEFVENSKGEQENSYLKNLMLNSQIPPGFCPQQ